MINRRELFWEEEQGLRKMTKIERMWEALNAIPPPHLRDDVKLERELALLDYYILMSIEEFVECEGQLRPRMIVLLRDCKRGVVRVLRQLHGELQYSSDVSYFERLLALSREVLRRVRIKEAYRIVRRDAERELEERDSFPLNPLFEDEEAVFIEDSVLSTESLPDSDMNIR